MKFSKNKGWSKAKKHVKAALAYLSNRKLDSKVTDNFYRYLVNRWDKHQMRLELEVKVLFLDNRNRIIGSFVILPDFNKEFPFESIDPSIAFEAALKAKASSILLAQNDPTDNLFPTKTEKKFYHEFVGASSKYKTPIQDYLILSPWGGYYSFAENKATDH